MFIFLKSTVLPLSLETRKKEKKTIFEEVTFSFTLAKFASGALFDISGDEVQF